MQNLFQLQSLRFNKLNIFYNGTHFAKTKINLGIGFLGNLLWFSQLILKQLTLGIKVIPKRSLSLIRFKPVTRCLVWPLQLNLIFFILSRRVFWVPCLLAPSSHFSPMPHCSSPTCPLLASLHISFSCWFLAPELGSQTKPTVIPFCCPGPYPNTISCTVMLGTKWICTYSIM